MEEFFDLRCCMAHAMRNHSLFESSVAAVTTNPYCQAFERFVYMCVCLGYCRELYVSTFYVLITVVSEKYAFHVDTAFEMKSYLK